MVVDCGYCGVKYFCVVGGLVVEYFPETLAVEGIEPVGLWLCECGRFHPICEHGDECGLVDSELPLCGEIAVPPEKVELLESCSSVFCNRSF